MKKWIAALLVLVLIVGTFPAALAAESTEATVQVGFGQKDVTPALNGTAIYLAGAVDARTATTAVADEPLYMKAVALSDGTKTHVVMTSDFIRVPSHWNEYVETAVLAELGEDGKEQYNLTEGFLSMSATHTHSSVDIGDKNKSPSAIDQGTKHHNSTNGGTADNKDTTYYTDYWLPGARDAVLAALADMETATIKTGGATYELPSNRMNWVRHWIYSDGTMHGVRFDPSGGKAIGHPRNADPELQLIHFVREGNEDIVLVNWQAHPTGAPGVNNTALSSEYCGVLCNYLQANYKDNDGLAPYAAFFQGAAGNIQYYTSVEAERDICDKDVYDYRTYGTQLGEAAKTLLESSKMKSVTGSGEVKSMRNEHTAVERGYKTTRTIQQDVVAIGGSIAFVTAGYEMFDSNGMYVKEKAREKGYTTVFVIENAQGHEYMPDWQACHYHTLLGGPVAYENEKTCHNLVPGTAEDLADNLVAMLNKLYDQ